MFFSSIGQIEAQKNKALSTFTKTRDKLSEIVFRASQAIEKNEVNVSGLMAENKSLRDHVDEMNKSIRQISTIVGDE